MSFESLSLLRLHVVADADPGALARVVERFQNLNLLPRRVLAEMGSNDLLRVEVDIFGATERELSLIAGKIREAPSIVNAYWHRL
jgi:hypothetical protein